MRARVCVSAYLGPSFGAGGNVQVADLHDAATTRSAAATRQRRGRRPWQRSALRAGLGISVREGAGQRFAGVLRGTQGTQSTHGTGWVLRGFSGYSGVLIKGGWERARRYGAAVRLFRRSAGKARAHLQTKNTHTKQTNTHAHKHTNKRRSKSKAADEPQLIRIARGEQGTQTNAHTHTHTHAHTHTQTNTHA